MRPTSPYPSLGWRKRWRVRKIFLFGFFFPDAMYHSIWGKDEDPNG